jgi:molecular chaperone GrpE
MSDGPPPRVAEGTAVGGAEALTPEAIESILADFRAWLRDANAAPAVPADAEVIDLHTLLAQFTALRHEVHLQTRAARAQQEQSAETLRRLSEAVTALRTGESQVHDEAIRPLVKTMLDTYDALALAQREVQRVEETLLPLLEESAVLPPEPLEQPAAAPSWLARLLGLDRVIGRRQAKIADLERDLGEERARRVGCTPQAADRARQMLASVVTGYTMGLQRIERALQQLELEPIPTVGQPFDPERMEVLEVVTDSGRASGEVISEVRRGYLWRGRVFRFAQVRVAKS